jgi:hypothetical protein
VPPRRAHRTGPPHAGNGDNLPPCPTRLVTGLPAIGVWGGGSASRLSTTGPSHDSGQLSATCTPDTHKAKLGRFRARPPAVDGGVGRAQPGTGRSKGQPPPFGRKSPESLASQPATWRLPRWGAAGRQASRARGPSALLLLLKVKALTPALASFFLFPCECALDRSETGPCQTCEKAASSQKQPLLETTTSPHQR